jgi:hypothetical protein
MKKHLLIVPVMLLALAGCTDEPDPAPTVTQTVTPRDGDLPMASKRWKGMSEDEQAAVCTAASGPLPGEGEIGGTSTYSPGEDPEVDYRGMLNAIEDAGFTQEQAAAMLPYALNECR